MRNLQDAINDKKERDLFEDENLEGATYTIPSSLELEAEIFLKIYKDDLLYVIEKELTTNSSTAITYHSLKHRLHKRLKEVQQYLEGI